MSNFKFYKNVERILEKTKVAENTYLIKYSIGSDFSFIPGQYVGIQVSPVHRRAYSVFKLETDSVWFLIDTKPGGIASKYFERVQVGAENLILGPYGRFNLKQTKNKKIFISTGTGMAPFYPMVEDIKTKDEYYAVESEFLFGCRYFADEISYEFFNKYISKDFKYIQCITQETELDDSKFPNTEFFSGRVTKYLENNYEKYSKNDEFYICGSPQMVEDVKIFLMLKGFSNVFGEKY